MIELILAIIGAGALGGIATVGVGVVGATLWCRRDSGLWWWEEFERTEEGEGK